MEQVFVEINKLRPGLDIYQAMEQYPDILPFDIVCADIRLKGLKIPSERRGQLLQGRKDVVLQLEDEEQVATIGGRENDKSPYFFDGDNLFYKDKDVIKPDEQKVFLKVVPSNRGFRPDFYFKGRVYGGNANPEAVLNLNFSQYCDNACLFCVRTYIEKALSDKEIYPEVDREYIEKIIDGAAQTTDTRDLSKVEQISIVTGIRKGPLSTTEALLKIYSHAKKYNFNGRMMYAGYNLSIEDVKRIASEINDFVWAYTVECFSKREQVMPSEKGRRSLEEIVRILQETKEMAGNASYFYIAGIDDFEVMKKGMRMLDFCTPPPAVQIFDIYNEQERELASPEFSLDYILKTMRLVRDVYYSGGMPDRGMLDGSGGLWMPQKGVMQLSRAYLLKKNLPIKAHSIMGPQGKVKII